MRKLLTSFLLIVVASLTINAQGDLDEQQKVFYRNERTLAFVLNSNGYGISYREGKRLDFLNKRLIDIDFNIIKDPQEIRLSNPYVQQGGSFVFGKVNSVYSIRGGIGHQHEIFKKMDLGGVSIRYIVAGGPVFAIVKPIYYNVLYPSTGNSYELRQEKFNEDIHQPADIYNKASYFKGFSEISVIPGIFAKGGFNFEYSKEDKVIHAIEFGASIDAYLKEVPIMASANNKALHLTLFVSYRVGLVIDPLNPGSNRFQTLFFRRQK